MRLKNINSLSDWNGEKFVKWLPYVICSYKKKTQFYSKSMCNFSFASLPCSQATTKECIWIDERKAMSDCANNCVCFDEKKKR